MGKWKIYYDDISPYSSDDGEPKDAPSEGVQVIISLSDNDKPVTLFGAEHYYFRRYEDGFGEWFHAKDAASVFTQFRKHAFHIESFISARTMRTKRFEILKRRAKRQLTEWMKAI